MDYFDAMAIEKYVNTLESLYERIKFFTDALMTVSYINQIACTVIDDKALKRRKMVEVMADFYKRHGLEVPEKLQQEMDNDG